MQMQSKKWWLGTAALTLALSAPIFSQSPLTPQSPLMSQAQAQALETKDIPASVEMNLNTFRPSAAAVLTPHADITADIKVAKTPPIIDFGILPGQNPTPELWSNWGDSIFVNGKYYATNGDHDGPYGIALVYEVDPVAKTMEEVVDINKAGNYTDKTKYSPGKVHSPIMDGGDGSIYFFGYRGKRAMTSAEYGYEGDPLIRYNTVTKETQNLGPIIPHNSIAASEVHIPSQMVYAVGNHGVAAAEQRDQFYAYDLKTRKLVFKGGPEANLARSIIMTSDGRVYFSVNKPGTGRAPDKSVAGDNGEPPVSVFAKYDPKTNLVTLTDIKVPGDGKLRAASRPDANGVIYAFSNSGVIFSFDSRTEQIKEIAKASFAGPDYTAVAKLDPTGRYLYYVPSAHGGSVRHGSAVFQLDTQTGERKVLAFLNDYFRDLLNYNLGGTFGIALNDDASQLFIAWNGRPVGGKNDDFGQTSVMIIHIPESERAA